MNKKKQKTCNSAFNYMVLALVFVVIAVIAIIASASELPLPKPQDKASTESSINAQEFFHDSSKKIKAIIGTKSQTRISFGPYSIKEVVGDSNKYRMIYDIRGMSVFILPKVKAGENIDITIISSGGKVQDLSLHVVDTEGSIISIKTGLRQTNFTKTSSDILENKYSEIERLVEAKKMLKAMVCCKKDKYDIIDFTSPWNKSFCTNCKKNKMISTGKKSQGELVVLDNDNYKQASFGDLRIREVLIYKYELASLKGVVLEIKNPTKRTITVCEKDLSRLFEGTVLTSMEYKVIQPKSSVFCYIIIHDFDQVKSKNK